MRPLSGGSDTPQNRQKVSYVLAATRCQKALPGAHPAHQKLTDGLAAAELGLQDCGYRGRSTGGRTAGVPPPARACSRSKVVCRPSPRARPGVPTNPRRHRRRAEPVRRYRPDQPRTLGGLRRRGVPGTHQLQPGVAGCRTPAPAYPFSTGIDSDRGKATARRWAPIMPRRAAAPRFAERRGQRTVKYPGPTFVVISISVGLT